MWSSKRSSGSAHVRRLCALGLPLEAIAPALLRALCREARCESGAVLWFDPLGRILNFYAPSLPPPRMMQGWFTTPQRQDRTAGAPMASPMPRGFHRLIEICADDDADERSGGRGRIESGCPHGRLCRELVPAEAPMQRLCSAVVKDGVPVAALMLYRPSSDPDFGREERVAAKAAARYLSSNGAVPVDTGAAMYRDKGEEALLICEPDGTVLSASANGYTLLAQASGCPLNHGTVPDEIEHASRRLLQRLLTAAEQDASPASNGGPPTVNVINAWGLLRLRAFATPRGPLGVLVERVDHLLVRLAEALWKMDVSIQQGEALLLLAQGLHHEQIALRMGVMPNTVDYHIRQLYSRLGVHSRDEALATLLDPQRTLLAA